jgi:hypothetical protein
MVSSIGANGMVPVFSQRFPDWRVILQSFIESVKVKEMYFRK